MIASPEGKSSGLARIQNFKIVRPSNTSRGGGGGDSGNTETSMDTLLIIA